MPTHKVKSGYKWGNKGKVYPTKAQADRQGRAIYANGYNDGSKLNEIQVSNDNNMFKPTISWMSQKYNELNKWLFDGELGECNFELYKNSTSLGHFRMVGMPNCYLEDDTRRIMCLGRFGNRIYVDKDNFFSICKPTIGMNSNYSGTEFGLLSTLVHEMCHYYTYMFGKRPIQAHGREFRQIGAYVSYKSNGVFSIQRLATAEDMSLLKLDDNAQERIDNRINNKKQKLFAVIVARRNGVKELTLTSSNLLIQEIIDMNSGKDEKMTDTCDAIFMSNDSNLIDFLFEHGYRRDMRKYRHWVLSEDLWDEMDDFKMEHIHRDIYENTIYLKNIIKEIINNGSECRIIQITSDMILSDDDYEIYN